MSDIEETILEKKIRKIGELLKEIRNSHKITIMSIVVDYLRYDAEKYSSFNKCAQGVLLPDFLIPVADEVTKKLEELLENPALINAARESRAEEENSSYKLENSLLVWLPIDKKKDVVPYTMGNDAGKVIEMTEGNWGLVAYRSELAEGQLNLEHIGNATDFKPGSEIAINRMDINDWETDCYYLIITTSRRLSVRELLPGDSLETIKYVSINSPNGPHKELQLNNILAIFSIEWAKYKPKPPKRTISQ
jgi:hypothetical protein